MKDGVVLFYCKEDTLYPVALNESEYNMLQMMVKAFEPLKIIDKPQGKTVDLSKEKRGE